MDEASERESSRLREVEEYAGSGKASYCGEGHVSSLLLTEVPTAEEGWGEGLDPDELGEEPFERAPGSDGGEESIPGGSK